MEKIKYIAILMVFGLTSLAQDVKPVVVIIDAGHGGRDGGALGVTGVKEKDVALEIALAVSKLPAEKNVQDVKIILTRPDDKFLSLDERVVLANQSEGDMFISLHLNASQSKKDRGFEMFYNDASTSDEAAKEVAEKENQGVEIKNEAENNPMFILWDLAQNEFIKESADLSGRISECIDKEFNNTEDKSFAIKNRSVKQATFVVLRGVRMPAVLMEMGFLSAPGDEELFKKKEFKDKYASAIFASITDFKEVCKKKKEKKTNE